MLKKDPSGTHGDDGTGNWALYANRLRLNAYVCSVPDEILQEIESADTFDWWKNNWDPSEENCICKRCKESAQRSWVQAKFLYREKLVRTVPWYSEDDRAGLLEDARKYWRDFFEPLQTYCLGNDANSTTAWKFATLKRTIDFSSVKDICPEDESQSYPEKRNGESLEYQGMRRVYAILALLNDFRRQGTIPENLPNFDPSIAANFQGVYEDYFCLGTQGNLSNPSLGIGGYKIYVGITNNLERRHKEHCGEGYYPGSKWIRKLTDEGTPPDVFGGWKIQHNRSSNDKAFEFTESVFTPLQEDHLTENLFMLYGFHNIRGGIYCDSAPWLRDKYLEILEDKKRATRGLPLQSRGSSPTIERRTTVFQRKEDDEALAATVFGTWNEVDDRGDFDHVKVCQDFGNGLINNASSFKPHSWLLWSSASDPFRPITHDQTKELINAVFPNVKGKLREKQQEAIKSYLEDSSEDLALAVPTAYGKTYVYMAAAIHEARKGNKVVIFLPYTALTSDIATNFAELSTLNDGICVQKSEVINVNLDARVKDWGMVYGGSFLVSHGEACQGSTPLRSVYFREIKWTIWRGSQNDTYMRDHEKSSIFQEADIILATPDKWAYPKAAKGGCDSFLDTFPNILNKLSLVIIDEAHQFNGVFGATQRELCRRLSELVKIKAKRRLNVLVASATLGTPTDAYEFSTSLTASNNLKVIQPENSAFFFPEEDFDSFPRDEVPVFDEVIEKLETKRDNLNRVLLMYAKQLSVEYVCNCVLQRIITNHRELRRVIVFVDSKTVASQYIAKINFLKWHRDGWPEGFKVFATPYHGDCASMHRRNYEKLMSKWVDQNQLHVIVTTSALEAGVNVRGADVIIIPNGLACTRDSLIQRIGRAGRKKGHPGLIIIGVGEGQSENLCMKTQSFLRGQKGKVGVSTTKAIVLNGISQFLKDVKFLSREVSWDDAKEGAEKLYRDSGIDDLSHTPNFRTRQAAENHIGLLMEQEIFVKGTVTARGMHSNSVKVLHCDEAGRRLRPWHRTNDEQDPPMANVVISRPNYLSVLKFLHPEAHYRTPHGKKVRVLHKMYNLKEEYNEKGWVMDLKSVQCCPLTIDRDCGVYLTKGWFDEGPPRDRPEFSPKPQDVSKGIFGIYVRSLTWKGFHYVNAHTMQPIADLQPVTVDDLCRPGNGWGYSPDFYFFQPSEFEHSAWKWEVNLLGDEYQQAPNSPFTKLLQSEIQLRAAQVLHCSPQQLVFHLKETQNGGNGHGLQLILYCYELSPTGLVRHCVRNFERILQSQNLIISSSKQEDKELKNALWDFDLKRILETADGDDFEKVKSALLQLHNRVTSW